MVITSDVASGPLRKYIDHQLMARGRHLNSVYSDMFSIPRIQIKTQQFTFSFLNYWVELLIHSLLSKGSAFTGPLLRSKWH